MTFGQLLAQRSILSELPVHLAMIPTSLTVDN